MKLLSLRGRVNKKYFQAKWLELLARVKTYEGMMLAIIDADRLLDEALIKKRFKGKTAGERLVSAQKALSDNDAVWYAHKLSNRLVHEPHIRLKKEEAKKALIGFKQALTDLGAL
ncbi:hypothetical protein A3F65_01835 [Candidatus Saccharibacteria bacterium RIFCSPHIGHO2_12_FULL_47_16b]|nr:MAG: hypothetical protein A3F65_01835 [Candidatus Saccharibacteria bacterium RIFCSPHIGHO2_12_FULL_47_16b]